MKKLLLIRHGEAADITKHFTDFDRPLTENGRADVNKAADLLAKQMFLPQLFYCSNARRTLETAAIITKIICSPPATLKPEIYEASALALLRLITQIDDRFDFVGLIGHNPGVSDLIYHLCNELLTMKTSAIIQIEMEVDSWKEVSTDIGRVCYRQ